MPLALRKGTANQEQVGPPHTSRPHLENVAALNSGRANSLPQICGDLLHSFARISVFAAGNRRDVEAYYCGKN
jgi:hypothetical protein